MTEGIVFQCKKCHKKFRTKDKEKAKKAICNGCVDFLPLSEEQKEEFVGKCVCGNQAKFSSQLLDTVFCSEKCYDDARQRFDLSEKLPEEQKPHIHFSARAETFFICGEVGFQVDSKDLNKVVGSNGEHSPIDSLMDSQLMAIAHAVGLRTDPFVRELLTPVIKGLVQLIWYRDIENNTSEHLKNNHLTRIDRYNRGLLEYKTPEPGAEPRSGNGRRRAPKATIKTSYINKRFVVVQGAKNVASGRESDLLTAAKSIKKEFTFADLVQAAQGKVKTKQDFEMICLRFLKDLLSHGAVKEIN